MLSAAVHHVVGDDLDGEPDALSQVLRDAYGVLDRLVQDGVPPDVALGVGCERLGRQAGQGGVDLAALLVVVALADELEIYSEVAALGPTLTFSDQRDPSGENEGEGRCIFGNEER